MFPGVCMVMHGDEPVWTCSPQSATFDYMSSQPIRIDTQTLQVLRERSARTGEPLARLAQRYIDEGLRLDGHPGVFFRTGPAGRRAVVVGGPDVWEVVAAARSTPERGEARVKALAERLGVSADRVRIALRYYAEYPDEVDRHIALVEEEAVRLEQTLERERRSSG
jgi:hypothetical protein